MDKINTHRLESDSGFKIDRIDHVQTYNPMEKHRHAYWEIYIFSEGYGQHLIEFEEYTFRSCSLHFVQPLQVHQLSRSEEANGLVIMFEEEFLQTSTLNKHLCKLLIDLRWGKRCPIIQLEDTEFQSLWNLIKILKQEVDRQDKYSKVTFANFLNIIFCKSMPYLDYQNAESNSLFIEIYQAFIQILTEPKFQRRTVSDIAHQLNCTTKQLRVACAHCAGMTPIALIHDALLHKAKQLLSFSNKPIKEIAHELNFTDNAHFSHFFKSKTGKTPNNYKLG